ncbi:MAG: hypothetical protein V4659_05600 [Pseudomonadota bacterium]
MKRLTILLGAGLLTGCGPAANDPAPAGVSASEAEALNEAAAALEDNGADAVTVDNSATPDNAQ